MKTLITMVLMMSILAGSAQAQNLLCDGGFEVGLTSDPGDWSGALPIGDPIGCWTVVGASNGTGVLGMPYGTLPILEGIEAVHIGNSRYDGGLEQSFATNIGAAYEVTFWGIAWSDDGDSDGTVRVYNAGGDDYNETFTVTDTTVGWTEVTFTFIPTDTTSTLEIMNCCSSALSIDGASVISLAPVILSPCENEIVVWEEGETTDCFTVVLIEAPEAEVTMTVDPSTADVSLNAEAPNDPVTLTFGTADWNVPQTVTVKANDDALAEGLEVVLIGIDATSTDSKFVFGAGIGATVVDNDAPGIQTVESQGSTDPQEGGASDSYTISLTFAPTDDVDIHLLVSDNLEDANQVVVDPENLTFTPANWQAAQAVTVTAVDDALIEAHPHPAAVSHTVSSTDGEYNGFAVDDVVVNVGENDCDVGAAAGAGQEYFDTDFDLNCFTDIIDFALLATKYLNCTLSICP